MRFLFLVAFFNFSLAQNLDVAKGLIDGQPLCSATVENITDTLGRPSAVEAPSSVIADVIGPKVFYHDQGIEFWFNPENMNGTLLVATFYLAETWDEENAEFFKPFSGQLVYSADPNWKLDDTAAYYSQYNPEVKTVEERNRELEELSQSSEINLGNVNTHVVSFQNESAHKVVFHHEEVTRFLERFGYLCEE